MKRLYDKVIDSHFKQNRQMLFLIGPRQVGKTTTSLTACKKEENYFYLNWDIQNDRMLIMQGADAVADKTNLHQFKQSKTMIVFDELHKYKKWKNFIKGFFDKYNEKTKIIITGSARLDVFTRGGDSLMGRYFPYHIHPFSVAEIINPQLKTTDLSLVSQNISDEKFNALFNFGGFPEPLLKRKKSFFLRWKKLRAQQLFSEDLRDLTKIQGIDQMEILAHLLASNVGQLTNYTSLANKVNVSVDTIRRWIKTLKSFYYCFNIQPWTKNISRSLLKEPKIYLWDWALVENEGARVENFIAAHLYKAVHLWNDLGLGEYQLHFLRDKEKREVDFLLIKNKVPWMLVEVKTSDNHGLTKSLFYYQNQTRAKYAIQVVFDMKYQSGNCFSSSKPIIVPAKTFLSQLI